jgi:hypothetical protein
MALPFRNHCLGGPGLTRPWHGAGVHVIAASPERQQLGGYHREGRERLGQGRVSQPLSRINYLAGQLDGPNGDAALAGLLALGRSRSRTSTSTMGGCPSGRRSGPLSSADRLAPAHWPFRLPGVIFGTPRANPCNHAAGDTRMAASPSRRPGPSPERSYAGLDERVQIPPAGLPVL